MDQSPWAGCSPEAGSRIRGARWRRVTSNMPFRLQLGQNRFFADVLGPWIKIVNAAPRIILGSIFLVAFGLRTFLKVLLAAVLVIFIVFVNAVQGVREVDPNRSSSAPMSPR